MELPDFDSECCLKIIGSIIVHLGSSRPVAEVFMYHHVYIHALVQMRGDLDSPSERCVERALDQPPGRVLGLRCLRGPHARCGGVGGHADS